MIRVNNEIFTWQAGLTIADIIEQKNYTFPALIVTINGQMPIDEENYGTTLVNDGDDVMIMHLIAGG